MKVPPQTMLEKYRKIDNAGMVKVISKPDRLDLFVRLTGGGGGVKS